MKKLILPVVSLLLDANANAQITLNSSSYPTSVFGTDSLKVTVAASTFPSFAAAANGSWDLSAVTDSTPVLYAYRVPTTTYQFADSNFYSLSTYIYQASVQSSIVSSGLLEYGVNVRDTGYSLTAVTFGASDSLIIPAQSTLYSSPRTKIAVPATYHSSWASTYNFDFDFVLSVAIAGLADSPGVVRAYTTEKDSVIGWGKMRVKTIAGTPSSWFDVLQVQTKTTTVDSFFIGGAPASGTLLSALGVTQGQVTTTYEQNYYRPEEVTAFANVQFTDSTYTTPTQATTHTQRTVNLGVAEAGAGAGVTIYPNPVNGGEVTITLPAMAGTWSYELIDMSGKTVAAEALTVSGNVAHLQIPASVAPGICYIRMSNNGKQIAVRAIDIVK